MRANTTPQLRGDDEGMPAPGGASWGHPPASTNQHHSGGYANASPTQGHNGQGPQHPHQQQQHYQQAGAPGGASPNGAGGHPQRPPAVDRRHSMPLTLANMHSHPGHSENPYGPPQPSPHGMPPGPRRTPSGLKRSYDEHGESEGIAPPAPAPGMGSYTPNGGVSMSASNSGGSGSYDQESPRVYKRSRDSNGGGEEHGHHHHGDYHGASDHDGGRSRPLGEARVPRPIMA
jgi:hypothetical protein